MEAFAFFVLTVLAILSALVVITHRHPVICALALAFNLVAIAGFYLLLEAQFIAFLQVIVYAGAIMVLILFVVMLLNLRDEARAHPPGSIQAWIGPILALLLVAILSRAILSRPATKFSAAVADYGTAASVGRELFGRFFYPFEVLSLLLVAAMVGAVLLAKKRL
jgi:NADH-quinone oxidoreductase subunit J